MASQKVNICRLLSSWRNPESFDFDMLWIPGRRHDGSGTLCETLKIILRAAPEPGAVPRICQETFPKYEGGLATSMVKWNPFRELEDMFDRYTRAVDWPRRGSQELVAGGDWAPRVDIAVTDNEFTITAGFKEGVLGHAIPKTEEAKPKAIEIEVK